MQPSDRPLILFVCNELGAFRHHREHLVRAAAARGYRAQLLAAPIGEATGADFEFVPVAIDRFSFRPLGDLRLLLTVLATVLRERPAVLHLIHLKPYLFGGLAGWLARGLGWRGRTVVTVAGLGRLYDTDSDRPGRASLRRRLVEAALRLGLRAAIIAFETPRDRQVWLDHRLTTPAQSTVVNGAGIDFSTFTPGARGTTGPLRVLFAGRLLRSKGLDVFIEAAGQLRGIEMLIAGFAENDPDAVDPETLRASPHVTFLGGRSDMAELLQSVDVVVLPSRYNEGTPRILIEAAATGCALVATRFPGSEMIIRNGRNGLYLEATEPTRQAAELAAILRDLAADRRQCCALGLVAARWIREAGFDDRAIADKFMALYGMADSSDRIAGEDSTSPNPLR